jgi:hypothetical protein
VCWACARIARPRTPELIATSSGEIPARCPRRLLHAENATRPPDSSADQRRLIVWRNICECVAREARPWLRFISREAGWRVIGASPKKPPFTTARFSSLDLSYNFDSEPRSWRARSFRLGSLG